MTQFTADYFDGHSSRRWPVTVTVAQGRLELAGADAVTVDVAHVRVQPRLGQTPTRLVLPGGGLLVTDDFDAVRVAFDVKPVVTLAAPLTAIYYRVLRTDLQQTLRSDHITFAKAVGLSPRRILLGRALRPSSLTLISVIGLNTALLLGGAVIVERLFSLPGLGSQLTISVATRDIVMVQGATLAIAFVYVLINLCVDIALTILDPRVRLSRTAA